MRPRRELPDFIALALTLLALWTASCADRVVLPSKHIQRRTDASTSSTARPPGWPYWDEEPLVHAPKLHGPNLPLMQRSLERNGPADARWRALDAPARASILVDGYASVAAERPAFGVGAYYGQLVCEGVSALVTLDVLFAMAFMAIESALADAEERVSAPALRTLLLSLDARLTAASADARPDLDGGLQVAGGVVAVARRLLDPSYAPGEATAAKVFAELSLISAHAGLAQSPLLRTPLDYSAFAPRGAVSAEGPRKGLYLATQWLGAAAFTFGAGEKLAHVDIDGARARARGALLVARFLTSEGDPEVRRALADVDRLDAFAFGAADTANPQSLADLAAAHDFDVHDSAAIVDATRLDRVRRLADAQLGAMSISPLRRPVDTALLGDGAGSCVDPVIDWLGSSGWSSLPSAERHASLYASALDAIAVELATPAANVPVDAPHTDASMRLHRTTARAAWSILRHGSVPFARLQPRELGSPIPLACSAPPRVLVEQRPAPIAALLGLVRQASSGLDSLGALGDASRSRPLLAEARSILELCLLSGAGSAAGSEGAVNSIPGRLAAMEAALAPMGGPFTTVVLVDGHGTRLRTEELTGLGIVYAAVTDPVNQQPSLSVGISLSSAERWAPLTQPLTDRSAAGALAIPPDGSRMDATLR